MKKVVSAVLAATMLTGGMAAVAVQTASPAAAAPVPALKGLEVTGWGMKSITVKWTNSGRGSYQQIQQCISGQSGSCKEIKVGVGASTYTLTNLDHGKTYRFKVRAVNKDGGNYSSPVYWMAGMPGKVGTPTATRGNTTAQVQWNKSTNLAATKGYTLYTYNSAGTQIKTQNVGNPSSSVVTANVTGLTNGTAYKFRVVAKNEYGSNPISPFSNTVTPASVPGAPTNLKTTPGNKSVQVSWTPGSNGGSAITGYNVQVKRGTGDWAEYVAVSGTTAAVTNLKNGEPVMIRVQAKNANGAGTYVVSDAVTPVGPPEQVAKPLATAGTAEATVNWVAPEDGGSEITGYDIQWAYLSTEDGQPENWTNLPSVGGNRYSATATGLETGRDVVFKVRAVNAKGEGAYSDTSDAVKVLKHPAPAAKDLKVAAGLNSLTLSWTPGKANGTEVAAYEAQVSSDGGKNWITKRVGPDTFSVKFDGLPGDKPFTSRVRSIAADGAPNSAWTTYSKSVAPVAQASPGNPSVSGLAWSSNSAMRVNVKAPAKAKSLQVRTAAGTSKSFGPWKTISKNTTRLAYKAGGNGITIQVRACTERCSAATTVVAKLSSRSAAASKKVPQVAGTITTGSKQTVFFRHSKKVQWRVKPSGQRTSGWRTSAPRTYSARPGMSFDMRTSNKKVTAKIRVLSNGSYQRTLKAKR